MIYSVDKSTDDIKTAKISDNLYLHNYFTLTVNAVNDAPVLLQPLDDLENSRGFRGCNIGAL